MTAVASDKCAIYCRTSIETELEYSSLDAQKERMEAYAKSQGWDIFTIYIDDGYSAKDTNRPKFQEMLSDGMAGKFKHILVYKIDRFTRSIKDFHNLSDKLDVWGINLISITQNIDTSSPMGRLLRNVLMDFAQFEREMTVERISEKNHSIAMNGYWNGGNLPLGYSVKDKVLQIIPDEAEAVQRIFAIFIETNSLALTQSKLKALGINNKDGATILKSHIQSILKNQNYIGKIRYKDKIYQGKHDPIISENVFFAVQATPRKKYQVHRDIRRVNILQGLLKCHKCKTFLTPHYSQKKKNDGTINYTYYYRCTNNMKKGKESCSIRTVNAEIVEKAVYDYILEIARNEEIIQGIISEADKRQSQSSAPLQTELNKLRKKVTDIEAEEKNIIRAFSQDKQKFDAVEKMLTEYTESKAILQKEILGIEETLSNQQIMNYDAELIQEAFRYLIEEHDLATSEEQRQLISYVVQEIGWDGEWLHFELYYMPEKFINTDPSGGSLLKRKLWWTGKGSNLRRVNSTDLQSVAINHSATCPFEA